MQEKDYSLVGFMWKFIGLSTDSKPTQDEDKKVSDGVLFYETDTSKLFVFFRGTWYEHISSGGGGGGGTTNFNQLSNRPKQAGVQMTGNTNIPGMYILTVAEYEALQSYADDTLYFIY